jgi:quercetin dioxygenase-like cupin family protein
LRVITLSRRQWIGSSLAILTTTLWREARSNIDDLAEQTHAFLASVNAPTVAPFLSEWPRTRERRPIKPETLPVIRWLPQVAAAASKQSPGSSAANTSTNASVAASPLTPTAALIQEFWRAAPTLSWHQTYQQPAVPAQFLANYGYTELAGLSGPIPSQHLACGFLLLGPKTSYPRHRHEAEEIYIPLAGSAQWQHGTNPWQEEVPGTVIHHVSDEPHAMRTGEQPMLALYLWRSNDLNQKSRLDRSNQPS